MRRILVDWLLDVCHFYRLQDETFHLTVMCIDRFLAVRNMNKRLFQLLGTACLLIAWKYQERRSPSVDLLVACTDHTYTRQELVQMEKIVLITLSHRVARWATSETFLQMILKLESKQWLANSATILTKLALHDYNMCMKYPPSLQAACAVYIAKSIVTPYNIIEKPWSPSMELVSSVAFIEAFQCIQDLYCLLMQSFNSETQTVWEYYGQDSPLKQASTRVAQPILSYINDMSYSIETSV